MTIVHGTVSQRVCGPKGTVKPSMVQVMRTPRGLTPKEMAFRTQPARVMIAGEYRVSLSAMARFDLGLPFPGSLDDAEVVTRREDRRRPLAVEFGGPRLGDAKDFGRKATTRAAPRHGPPNRAGPAAVLAAAPRALLATVVVIAVLAEGSRFFLVWLKSGLLTWRAGCEGGCCEWV